MYRNPSQLANFSCTPQEHDWFCTKSGTHRSPSCVEYSDKAPHGIRYGELDGGVRLQATEVAVVRIPAWHRKPAQWGIAIRCASTFVIGGDAWINVSRGRSTFAWPSNRLPAVIAATSQSSPLACAVAPASGIDLNEMD